MQTHFVEFLSPGTFVSEVTRRAVESWNVDEAVGMARDVIERHAATPYGFRFTTRSRAADELDSKVTNTSGVYYLGGKIRTAEEILAGTDPSEAILRSNVEINGIKRVIVNDNYWRFTAELRDEDTVLEFTP